MEETTMTTFKTAKLITLILLIINLSLPFGAMDLARVESRTDLAISSFGVTGQGVIVAIIDRGIDWRNNDFRNEDGTTRIKYIFDITDNTGAGAPDNTYGVGTIYTEAQINAALAGGTPLATRDAVGHGTTTAGIAAGNGRNHPQRRFRGIAPDASIIVVKFLTEGAIAHGNEPAEPQFRNDALFPTALAFVRDKAAQLGMPVVMLANFGSIGGPTDGTSMYARSIDAIAGPGRPGIIFVTGTGDEGSRPNHAGGTVAQGATVSIPMEKADSNLMQIDLWYPGSDRFTVSLQTPVGNFGPYAPPAQNIRSQVLNSTFEYYHNGGGNTLFYGAQNNKREIFVRFLGPAGNYTLQLQGTTVTDGRFDVTMAPARFNSVNNRFLSLAVPGSMIDQAAAFNNIAPNSYNIRNSWVDVNGVARQIVGHGALNDIWFGSSVGPTFDGRLGVDLSAPGDSVFTSLAPNSVFGLSIRDQIQEGNGFYTRQNAVSGAAPQVTGLIALMLQKNRNLDAIQVRDILRRSARKDSFTGPAASTTWGHGKMDSLNAMSIVASGFEGDVAPRPNGDNSMLSTDITQLRRFVSGLDTPNGATNEVQRIDCAPRTTSGDGIVNSSDVVQGRRYVSGLDPTTLAGGPATRPSVTESVMSTIEKAYSYFFAREVKIGEAIIDRSTSTVPIEINPGGDEVAISFTLEYDATRFLNPRVVLGEAAAEDSTLTVNANEKGRIGILIDSTEPMAASAMAKQLLTVTFDVIGEGQSRTAMSITGSLAELGVSDSMGNLLAARYVDGKIVLDR